MKFFSRLFPLNSGMSKNVQNYKKMPIYPKFKTLKNYNFNRPFPPLSTRINHTV